MAVQFQQDDILAHINPENSLHNQAIVKDACLTIFDYHGIQLQLCYDIQGDEVCVEVKMSALGRSIELGHACLTKKDSSVTFSGHIDSLAKAEVTISLETNPLGLCFQAKACYHSFTGWHCGSTDKHCIHI